MFCKVFGSMETTMHGATRSHSGPQAGSDTLQEYIKRIMDLKIQATVSHPIAITCWVTIMLLIRHLFHKEIKNQMAGAKQ